MKILIRFTVLLLLLLLVLQRNQWNNVIVSGYTTPLVQQQRHWVFRPAAPKRYVNNFITTCASFRCYRRRQRTSVKDQFHALYASRPNADDGGVDILDTLVVDDKKDNSFECDNKDDDDEIHDLYADLNSVGLGLCHGILHASGVRYLSDLPMLTSTHLDEMGIDSFDRRAIRTVVKRLKDDASSSTTAVTTNPVMSTYSVLDEFGSLERGSTILRSDQQQQNFEMETLSQEHHVYKGRLFTKQQCEQINRMAESYAYQGIGQYGVGWTSQLYTLTNQHMQCKDIPNMISSTRNIFTQLLEHELYALFPTSSSSSSSTEDGGHRKNNNKSRMRIRPGTIRFESDEEPHLVRYSGPRATGTKLHMDNSKFISITINVLLSSPDDYRGGGTYIEALNRTIHLEQGEMLIHLGNLQHAGVDITSGVRRILVAFLKCDWEEDEEDIDGDEEKEGLEKTK